MVDNLQTACLVIQGSGDVGRELTECEVQDALDFCAGIFAPTTPEMHSSVADRLDPRVLSPDGPIMLQKDIVAVFGEHDKEIVHVVWEVNARKPIHTEYDIAAQFCHEAFGGYISSCERGKLGLSRIETHSK